MPISAAANRRSVYAVSNNEDTGGRQGREIRGFFEL
jgi:hypothetical protein